MLLSVMGVGFDNSFMEVKCLQDNFRTLWMGIKNLKTLPLLVNIVLWLWVRDWILWVANCRFPFYEICVQNNCEIKLWDPVEDSDAGGPSSITVRMKYLLFNADSVNVVWKTNEGEAESIDLLIFVLWQCLNCRRMRDGGVGEESLI